jgi:hypothetical protein
MDGTASVGTASTVARSDHKHPTDTSRASQADLDALETVVAGKANSPHTHTIANVSGLQTALDGKQATGSYAVTTTGNTFDGEQRMVNSLYCPTMNDIANGVGCSLKNSRACDNQLIVAEIFAPYTAVTDSTLNMTSTKGELPFYSISSVSDGKITGKTQLAKITSSGIYEGNTLLANKYAPAYSYGTSDLTAGSSALETGKLHFVYE